MFSKERTHHTRERVHQHERGGTAFESVHVPQEREPLAMAFGDDHGFGRGGMPPERGEDPEHDREARRQDAVEVISSSLEVLVVSLPLLVFAPLLPGAIALHVSMFAAALIAAGLARAVAGALFTTGVSDFVGIVAGFTGAFFINLAVESMFAGAALGGVALLGGVLVPAFVGVLGVLASFVVPRFLRR